MGADQEGARVITTQSKAEENHYKLHHRWAIDCTVYSARLNLHSFSSHRSCDCCGFSPWLFVCLCTCVCAQVCLESLMHLGVILKVNQTGQPRRQWTGRGHSVPSQIYAHYIRMCVYLYPELVFSLFLFWSYLLPCFYPSCCFHCVSNFVHVVIYPFSPPRLPPAFTLFIPSNNLLGQPDWAVELVSLCVCAHHDQSKLFRRSLSTLIKNQTLVSWIRPKI